LYINERFPGKFTAIRMFFKTKIRVVIRTEAIRDEIALLERFEPFISTFILIRLYSVN